jgi:hypothetical protein
MHESVVRDFFVGKVPASALQSDLVGAVLQTSSDVFTQYVTPMEDRFVVRKEHLVRLCDAVLAGDLAPESLEPIAFCLIASEHFDLEDESEEGERVLEVLHDWDSPEINYVLSISTVAKFRLRLLTGQNTFTADDLPQQKKKKRHG